MNYTYNSQKKINNTTILKTKSLKKIAVIFMKHTYY